MLFGTLPAIPMEQSKDWVITLFLILIHRSSRQSMHWLFHYVVQAFQTESALSRQTARPVSGNLWINTLVSFTLCSARAPRLIARVLISVLAELNGEKWPGPPVIYTTCFMSLFNAWGTARYLIDIYYLPDNQDWIHWCQVHMATIFYTVWMKAVQWTITKSPRGPQ